MHAPPDLIVRGLALDSRKVEEGFLFFALPGEKEDGGEFIAEAKARGAACAVCEHPPETEIPYILVPDAHKALALCAAVWYGTPAGKLTVVGVTGTNGKTTVTTLIRNILSDSGTKTLLTGTVCNRLGDENLPSGLTTPKPPELYSLLSRAVSQRCKACVMEASSQALAQGRLEGIDFDAAVFTNITRDHLDYHGTFENYISAKKKLFEHSALSIVNLDDPRANEIIAASKGKIITFSTVLDCADYTAKNISLLSDCVRFELVSKGHIEHIEFASPGLFSVSNAMAAAVCAINLGIEPKDAAQSLAKSKSVCGRLERVECSAPYSVIIDYAHTPDGLKNILSTFRECEKNRLIAVFGCGGDRDKTKRPIMGSIAEHFADYVIVTSDNPRSEDPRAIIDDILVGMRDSRTPYKVIENRIEAIKYAVSIAQPGDIIVLAGKGHETYQILKDGTIHLDEREVVAEALRELK